MDRAHAARGKVRVFLVDDDEGLCRSSAMLLEAEGFAVETFTSADLLLAYSDRACGPDQSGCLVLDLHLPGSNGFALLSALRTRGSTLPAMLITAGCASLSALAASHPGAAFTAVLEKPFRAGTLLRSIRAMLSECGH